MMYGLLGALCDGAWCAAAWRVGAWRVAAALCRSWFLVAVPAPLGAWCWGAAWCLVGACLAECAVRAGPAWAAWCAGAECPARAAAAARSLAWPDAAWPEGVWPDDTPTITPTA